MKLDAFIAHCFQGGKRAARSVFPEDERLTALRSITTQAVAKFYGLRFEIFFHFHRSIACRRKVQQFPFLVHQTQSPAFQPGQFQHSNQGIIQNLLQIQLGCGTGEDFLNDLQFTVALAQLFLVFFAFRDIHYHCHFSIQLATAVV
jgi:hypothetical protein